METKNEVSYYLEKIHYDLIEYFCYENDGEKFNVLSCETLTELFGKNIIG